MGSSGELFVEYLVRNCAMSDKERDNLESFKEYSRSGSSYYSFQYKRLEVYISLDIVFFVVAKCSLDIIKVLYLYIKCIYLLVLFLCRKIFTNFFLSLWGLKHIYTHRRFIRHAILF